MQLILRGNVQLHVLRRRQWAACVVLPDIAGERGDAMIRIIVEIPDNDADFREISREIADILQEAPWNMRLSAELISFGWQEVPSSP